MNNAFFVGVDKSIHKPSVILTSAFFGIVLSNILTSAAL
jgi:hypothetical protein